MKLIADCHVHTNFSGDSTSSMESMIEQGIKNGLSYICFTDHMDYDYPEQYLENGCQFEFDVDAYFSKIQAMQKKYKDQINILAGIELGIQPHLADRLENLVSSYPFDFVIASSHLLKNYDPYYPDYWKQIGNNEELGLRKYFQSIRENVESFSNFDVYGHLDYIVRYVPDQNYKYDPAQFQEELDALLKLIIGKGKGIELNTAGLKYGLPFSHPKEEIFQRFFELGGTYYTIGSDAHKPKHLSYAFDEEGKRLEKLSIPDPSVFVGRKPISFTVK